MCEAPDMRSLPWCLVLLISCAHSGPVAEHHFDDAEAWAQRFEDPTRDQWQRPDEVIAALQLTPQTKVADIGAATGYFPVRFAKVAARVYGIDIESSMVEYLTHRAERESLNNLTAVLASSDDAKIPEPVQLITIIDTYHHLENRPVYFTALRRSLAPGGRIAIIDFRMGSARGPPAEAKVSAETVIAELKAAGFTLEARHEFLPDQYFVVFH